MADIAIFRINYKSDFILTLQSDAGWTTPFCIKFWTGAPSKAYYAYYDGMSYTHCTPVEGEPTKLLVQFDDHHLPIGDLKFQIGYHFTVADFSTSVEDEVINQASVIIEVDDAPAQVMLDFNGETAPEIEFSLPAYANEAQRIANEQARIAAEEQRIANEQARITAEEQRIANEQARISAEETRQANEQQRINAEAERVSDFASLKTESEAATAAANIAATLANEKAQLAADKAALAQAAATLANEKAQLAEDKANLAQQKADYAQTQGNYAKAQGDAAKTEAEAAHSLNEEVSHDEATRQQQETARQQAESQRVTDFNAQMQQQQTAYADAEAVRDTAFDDAETERDAKVDAKVADITNLQAQIGYFVCDTNADTAAKTITATGYALTKGGNIRIKMTNANTADSATLNINSTGAKALFYNGAQASSTNSWEAGEVVEVYYDGNVFIAGKATVKELKASRLVVFSGGSYFNAGGYYNSNMEVIVANGYSYTNLIDVSEYTGLLATFNFTSGINLAFSGFLNENDEIFDTFRGKTKILIPEGAVKMWVTAINSDAATMSITIKTPLSDDEIDHVFNMDIMEGVRHVQSETTNLGGYYKPDGYTIGNGGYHLKLDVTQYRGMMVTFKPCWNGNTFTGFKLSDDTYLRIPVSNSEDFTYIVPSNAVELRASFTPSQTDRYVVFSIPRALDDVYNDLLTREDAADEFVSKDVFTETYNIDTTQCEQGKYYDGNGNIGSNNSFYAFKIADFTDFQGVNWVGGKYTIGGHLYTGGVARCGFYNTDNTITLITSTEQYSGEILPTMKGMFLSFQGDISDAQCELVKFDAQIVNRSQLEQAVQEAKDYTDEKMVEIGTYKLPNVKWYVLGDSISAYSLYVGAGNHYYEFIAARNNMTFDPQTQVRAADGRTLSAITNNSICYDVDNLTAPKIITILAGINDFGHNIPLGTLVDSDGYCVAPPETAAECTDFAKGLLYVLSNLKANYPSAVIIYILPLRNNGMQTNALGLRLEKYWEYIRIACQAYSVPIINLGTECVLMSGGTYYVDRVHPNVNGQKIMSYFIENYMSLLVPTVYP